MAESSGSSENAQKPPVTLTAEQAEILLRRNLANLAKKVKDGRTLTARELNLLQSALAGDQPSTVEFADNASELATLLGVNRKTIQRWRKTEGNPGVRPDGRYHVPAWRAFKATRPAGEDDEIDAGTQTQARAQQLLLQNEKLKIQIAIMRREYMPCIEIEKQGAELGAAIRKVVATIHLAAPNVVGVSVAEAEARLKELEDEILEQLHQIGEAMKHWKESYEPID